MRKKTDGIWSQLPVENGKRIDTDQMYLVLVYAVFQIISFWINNQQRVNGLIFLCFSMTTYLWYDKELIG